MSNADLYQGLQMFSNGLKEAAINQGISNAFENVQEINQSQMQEMEKRAAQQAVANQLAATMAGAGASGQQYQMAMGAVAPKALEKPEDFFAAAVTAKDPKAREQYSAMGTWMQDKTNAPEVAKQEQAFQNTKTLQEINDKAQEKLVGVQGGEQRDTAKQRFGFDVAIKKMELASAEKIAQAKAANSIDDKQKVGIDNNAKRFMQYGKKHLEAMETAKLARSMLESGNPMADNSVSTMLAKATGDVGNLTDSERLPYKTSKAILARIEQVKEEMTTGKISDENRQWLLGLVDIMEDRNKKSAEGLAEGFVKSASRLHKVDPDFARSVIYPEYADELQSKKQEQQQLAQPANTGAAGTPPAKLPNGSTITPQMKQRASSFYGGRSGTSIPRKGN